MAMEETVNLHRGQEELTALVNKNGKNKKDKKNKKSKKNK